ncbi:MAG: ferredoxin [Smithella sp.]|jgi:ferredoxin
MKQGTLPSIKQRIKENVPGKYYIIDKCISCSLCYELSPRNFSMNLDEGYDFVFKQPETQEDEALCLKAMQFCPADAIRDDGLGPVK